MKAHVLDDELEGRGWVETKGAGAKKTTNFELSLASSHLDLDKMLLPDKTTEKKKPLDPKTFAGVSGHAAVKIDRLRMRKQDLTDIVADVTMSEDDIKAETTATPRCIPLAPSSGWLILNNPSGW